MITPLNWGIGHATRIHPIASMLKQKGHNVFIAIPLSMAPVIDKELNAEIVPFPSITIKYSAVFPLFIMILLQLPMILIQAARDHYRISSLIKKYNIDILINDNRFGVYNRKVYSVYITHQLNIHTPGLLKFAGKAVSLLHRKIAGKYDECWIPDMPGDINLSGKLSHLPALRQNFRYCGILSRMSILSPVKPANLPEGDFLLIILSGPEPQRSILEKLLTARLSSCTDNVIIATGRPDHPATNSNKKIKKYSYLSGGEIKYLIQNSVGIICRSGYSTVMDLVTMKKSALLIPTPGQTEQEYLATCLQSKGWFKSVPQNKTYKSDLRETGGNTTLPNMARESEKLIETCVNGLTRKRALPERKRRSR